jgi:hypothetical protein
MTPRAAPGQQSIAELVAEGQAALLAGEKARAQALLRVAVRDAPDNVEAWLWLSGTHSRPEEMAYCLRQALDRDPHNEQALEGLAWIEETFGPLPELDQPKNTGQPELRLDPARLTPMQLAAAPATARALNAASLSSRQTSIDHQTHASRALPTTHLAAGASVLMDAALHVASVGALLGLLRLTGALRPETLLLARPNQGAIGVPAALGVALAAALLHGLALLAVWGILSRGVSRSRDDRRGDTYDSLVRTAEIFGPGYLAAVALLAAASGLAWSERRWLLVVLFVWAMLGAAAVLAMRRFWRLLDHMRISRRRAAVAARILLPALLAAVAGLGIAGLIVQALLRVI